MTLTLVQAAVKLEDCGDGIFFVRQQARNGLANVGIVYLGDLVTKTEKELQRLPGLGRIGISEIKYFLGDLGLSLGMDIPGWPRPSGKVPGMVSREVFALWLQSVPRVHIGELVLFKQDKLFLHLDSLPSVPFDPVKAALEAAARPCPREPDVTVSALQATLDARKLEIIGLRDALRKVALVHTYRPDGKGGTAFVKVQCEVCDAECGPDQMITHVGDCPLTVLNPQPQGA